MPLSKKNKIVVATVVSVVVAALLSTGLYFLITAQKEGSNQGPNRFGFSASELERPLSFYSQKRNATLTYLNAVYPQAKESLAGLSDVDLALFYNSLWFYYNCAYQYSDNDLSPPYNTTVGQTWGPMPCANTFPLPYPPQGYFYHFWTYHKYNVPVVYSNSDDSVEHLKLANFGSGRPGIGGIYSSRGARPSGIMWVNARTIQRYIWQPYGLLNDKPLSATAPDAWTIRSGSTPKWDYPKNWLTDTSSSSQYIEVTHGPADVGDAVFQSPWWWYNVCVGSGLFLYLGNTIKSVNKVAGVFDMVVKLAQTKEGSDVLLKFYGSTDPYDICFGIFALCGYNSVTKQSYCNFSYVACGNACAATMYGYLRAAIESGANIQVGNCYEEIIKYQNSLGILDNYPTRDGIRAAFDAARLNTNYNLAHISINLLADENLFFLATNLDIDTIQLVMDYNGNDLFVYEIIDTRVPARFRAAAKQRDYSGFIDIKPPNTPNEAAWSTNAVYNRYNPDIIKEYLQTAYDNKWLSLRDPLDVNNDSKASKCTGVIITPNTCPNDAHPTMFCAESPASAAYKCLLLGCEYNNSCVYSGNNITA